MNSKSSTSDADACRGHVVSVDGALLARGDAKVSVYDRGFLYGDAVFEVLRTYGGEPFALAEHVARLRRSADSVLIRMPIDERAFEAEIRRAIAAAGNAESYARIMLTRGTGPLGLDPELAGDPLRVIIVEPVAPLARGVYERGIALATIAVRRPHDDTAAAGAKISNYLSNLLAVREAKQRGAAEALLVDANGWVTEGASSNVFIVQGGKLITPPLHAGILAGITRANVIAAADTLRIPVEERNVTRDDVYAAAEVFITSSIRELAPAVSIDGRPVGSGVPGDTVRALHRAFRARVGLGDRPMPWEA